jgi:hypothetical protein
VSLAWQATRRTPLLASYAAEATAAAGDHTADALPSPASTA